MTAPAIQGTGLTRSFGRGAAQTVALHQVSLLLAAEQVVLVMGPSGSGKSTLLAVLSGLLPPDSGQVVALGQDLWQLAPAARKAFRLRHCGFIFQGYNLFPALTACQQLEMILRWGEGMAAGEARRRAADWLDRLGLGGKGQLLPSELSGGEQQRIAIGRALIKEPNLCFADEPTAALDWGHGRQIIELLRATAREHHATVLIVAHDTRIVPFADRVLHLEDGILAETTSENRTE